jgi:hypothetical protein
MRASKLFLLLILSMCFFGCAFEENREVEDKLTKSVNNFHALFNQEKFNEIYFEVDDELKNKFTEHQFVSYLEVVKGNDTEKLKDITHVWLKDDLKDAAKRILVKRTKFSNVELVFTEKAMFREKFEWNLRSGEPKLTAYQVEKICDKPCRLVIDTK